MLARAAVAMRAKATNRFPFLKKRIVSALRLPDPSLISTLWCMGFSSGGTALGNVFGRRWNRTNGLAYMTSLTQSGADSAIEALSAEWMEVRFRRRGGACLPEEGCRSRGPCG